MGVRFETTFTNTVQNALPASNAETIIFSTGAMLLAVDSAVVFLQWMVNIIAGTGTTAFVFRIRRGAVVSGTSIGVNTWTQKVTAASQYIVGGCYFDQPGPQLLVYSLTIQQGNASGAGTLGDGNLLAYVL